MGADYPGQEEAIEELKNLSPDAKKYLNHHICGALTVISNAAYLRRYELILQQVGHIVDDLVAAGIRKRR